jgi:hypothetical protein
MLVLIGKGEHVGEQELATVAWLDDVGMLILGPGAEIVAEVMERDYRRWYDPSGAGQWLTLEDEELVRSLLYRLPRPQWWAIEVTESGDRLPQTPYDPNGTIWRQLARDDRAAATMAARSLLAERFPDPNLQTLLLWIEGEKDEALYHFVGLSPAAARPQKIVVYRVRTGDWHAVLEAPS